MSKINNSNIRNKPFSLNKKRISKSPMKTIEKVKEVLKKYYNNENIGFTYISCLKSLGLIPRSDGFYKLGEKYLNIF